MFVGQLFRGNPKDKSWASVVSGQVTLSIQRREPDNVWMLVATKQKEQVRYVDYDSCSLLRNETRMCL